MVRFADQLGLGALERDLAGGHRPGPQLVLEAVDAIGIAAAVRDIARNQEEREAARSRRRALRPRQCQRDLAPDVGAEEFLPEEAPAIPITFGDNGVSPDVRAALSFGHPLSGGPRLARIAADQVPDHLTRLPDAAGNRQDASSAVGHRDRT